MLMNLHKKSNELWQGNIVQDGSKGGKTATSNSTLKDAVNKVMKQIGLEPIDKKTKKPLQTGLF